MGIVINIYIVLRKNWSLGRLPGSW